MAGKKGSGSHHVTPRKDTGDGNKWAVVKGGASKPSGLFPTKKEATEAGREISSNQGTELVIHGKDGKIQGKDSHGNDPNPPKG